MFLDPAALGSIASVIKISSEENIIDVHKVNQRHWLEESGHWLENVGQVHLVLARGKRVLQKV